MKGFLVVLSLIAIVLFPAVSSALSQTDIFWLTQNIYHEARGESDSGKTVIGLVTLDRLHDGRWGNSIQKVVTSKHQFSWYWDGKSDVPKDKKEWEDCKSIALLSVGLHKIMGYRGMLFYHDSSVSPQWKRSMKKVMVIGGHTFYKEKKEDLTRKK